MSSKPCGTRTFLLLFTVLILGTAAQGNTEEPDFVEPMTTNMTAPAGRDIKLACSVKNLGIYKVAWIHYDRLAILTVHNHVVTRNPRISVSHDRHTTWFLKIHNLQESDKGLYMCQINTPKAKTKFVQLHVVVPPSIDDSRSSSDVNVRELTNLTLHCEATGNPTPKVKWKREDDQKIHISKVDSVTEYEGNALHLFRVGRLDMAIYLCIASNGVPPTVSKRIKVNVEFPPRLWIPHQLVGAPVGYSVQLECFTEAYPESLNYWTRDDLKMLHNSSKHLIENVVGTPSYKQHMKLTIFNLQPSDFGPYTCVSKNPKGETDGNIKLYRSAAPTTEVVSTTATETQPAKFKDHGKEKQDNSTLYKTPSLLTESLTDKASANRYDFYSYTIILILSSYTVLLF